MDNKMKRMLWIIPNICFYLTVIFLSIWVVINMEALDEINRLDIFRILIILILGVSISGSYRIVFWIRSGQL
ncbi:hypothetical protein BK128_01535 [Viridibacillus sp. FSL H7-0596]|uniref:Uncharacterized protein n=1 Tax=Viridibacillus arenosi FSL R5-213 TaxID=1227360 RepID=W4EMD7_9BACL|nr:hypothetical protein C176_20789 [Viridibacillus arenosi FSL R5-213]OMC88647.1 hypothetical protein BK128_01535 [Viridibacillus sp. FSL H7-0596]OMC93280.1 hypothetical protein BK137_01830 [Viridibacillus arenosi]